MSERLTETADRRGDTLITEVMNTPGDEQVSRCC
jgi:hypothetical protein